MPRNEVTIDGVTLTRGQVEQAMQALNEPEEKTVPALPGDQYHIFPVAHPMYSFIQINASGPEAEVEQGLYLEKDGPYPNTHVYTYALIDRGKYMLLRVTKTPK